MKSKPGLVVLALDGAVPSYIRQKIKENRLPAFKRFSEMGCWFSDCRPPFPTITPTCWASFSTGAAPVTHGAVCQDVHVPGTALDEAITAYNSENIRAERFWEAAGRIGKKSLIIQLPTSGPARSDKVLQVAGAGCSTIRYEYPHEPTASPEGIQHLVPAQLFVSGDEKGNSAQWIYRSPASGQWQPGEKKHVKHDIEIVEDRIAMLKADMSGVNSSIYPFNWYVKIEDGQVKLSETLEKVEDGVIIPEGQWSPVIVSELE
ncbi:MAG: alkaline phosphatase family protein, partial [Clostridiaceae bacterium]|nr:alkaline phosphatase family protein [Clostridiaceae bacterium]